MRQSGHAVWRRKLARFALLINKAVDDGNCEVPIEEVRTAAREGRIFQFTRFRVPHHERLGIGHWTAEDEEVVNEWCMELNLDRSFYVEKRGLCLLQAWIIRMMEEAADPGDLEREKQNTHARSSPLDVG